MKASLIIFIFFSLLVFSAAQDVFGQEVIFNIESSYDISGRSSLSAILLSTSPEAYWYADASWWNGLAEKTQENIKASLDYLIIEFNSHIYPILTRTFGSEWNPGIDKDTRITILIHPMKEKRAGYFNSADEYPKAQIPDSNEKEMIYLNPEYLTSGIAKSFLAHEFMHLITFNQKDKNYGVSEDVWLNEARAEYASTLLGYDDEYEGSNLQRRIRDFLNKPSDSLAEWRDLPEDYGVANLFTQYLTDHYGVQILTDSLRLPQTGISGINTILAQKGFKEDFAQAFANWAMAVLVNDCQISEKYCYFNKNLQDFRIVPLLNYLPSIGPSTLSVVNSTKDWAGNWHKFIGGDGILTIEFKANAGLAFKVPYALEKKGGDLYIDFLELNKNGEGKLQVADFGSQNIALTIIPIAQNKTAGFSRLEPSRFFSWSASTQKEEENIPPLSPPSKPVSQMTRQEIIARIFEVKNLIVQLQSQLAALTGSAVSCQFITQNLYFGMSDNLQVRCLQEFLKSQGKDIYPEGLVSGNFYTLTEKAVARFQERYASEILSPLGLSQGTGYVGSITIAKINELLTK